MPHPLNEWVGAREVFYLTIRDPLVPEWRDELDRHNVTLLERVRYDSYHPDFNGRPVTAIARGRQEDFLDPHGHETHVAGLMLASGAASRGQFSGRATMTYGEFWPESFPDAPNNCS